MKDKSVDRTYVLRVGLKLLKGTQEGENSQLWFVQQNCLLLHLSANADICSIKLR